MAKAKRKPSPKKPLALVRPETRTPKEMGYSFPPEWAPHRATWLSWPRPEGASFPGRYHKVIKQVARLAVLLAETEAVEVMVPNSNWAHLAKHQFRDLGLPTRNIRFHEIPTQECWCRDFGPTFLKRTRGRGPTRGIVDWRFNAYGGKYRPFGLDDRVPTRLAEMLRSRLFLPGITMEGGSIDVNGHGTLLTTRNCLLNRNRNPELRKAEIEAFLLHYYCQEHVVWLDGHLVGDDTDGHVDDLARFVNERTVVIAEAAGKSDPNAEAYRSARRSLELARDAQGRKFHIVSVPSPGPVEVAGVTVPATHLNFYFCNQRLLVPTFGRPESDQKAIEILAELLPGREVLGVDCRQIIWGRGAIHCLTQQEPR